MRWYVLCIVSAIALLAVIHGACGASLGTNVLAERTDDIGQGVLIEDSEVITLTYQVNLMCASYGEKPNEAPSSKPRCVDAVETLGRKVCGLRKANELAWGPRCEMLNSIVNSARK